MILRLLRHGDHNAILNGAREASKNAPIQDAGKSLRFYADYSAHTSQRRKAFVGVQKYLREKGISSFMICPATLKITLDGEQRSFSTPEDTKEFLRGSVWGPDNAGGSPSARGSDGAGVRNGAGGAFRHLKIRRGVFPDPDFTVRSVLFIMDIYLSHTNYDIEGCWSSLPRLYY